MEAWKSRSRPPRSSQASIAAHARRPRSRRLRFAALIAVSSLAVPAAAQDQPAKGKVFRECGATPDLAKAELSKAIHSRIVSEFEMIQRANRGDETLEVKDELSVSSQLDLYDVEVRKEGKEFCAYQTRQQLERSFLEALQAVTDSCDPDDMAANDASTERRIVSCREKALLVETLNPLFYRKDAERRAALKKVRAWLPRFEAMAKAILHQGLKFNLSPPFPDARVVIDHTPRPVSDEIPLSAGEVKYELQVGDYCPVRETVDLRKGSPGKKNIQRVDVELENYKKPEVIFKVDVPWKELLVNGEPTDLDRVIKYPQCSGELPYVLTTQKGQRVEGTVELEPGQRLVEDIVVPDRDFLAKITEQWETRDAILFRYGGGVPLSGEIGTDWVQTVQLEYLTVFDPIRLGGGVLYGYGGEKEHIFEAYGRVAAQLTRIGDLPLHIGSRLAFVPYIGVDVGLGYSGLLPRNTNTRGDFGSTAESIIVFRGVAGTSLALNKVFNLIAEAHWEFVTRGQRLGVTGGLGFLF